MKKTKSFLMLIGAFSVLIGGAVIFGTIGFEQNASAQINSSKQWETMVVRGGNSPEGLQGSLNMRGAEGWEPVTVIETKDGNFVAYLKRRK